MIVLLQFPIVRKKGKKTPRKKFIKMEYLRKFAVETIEFSIRSITRMVSKNAKKVYRTMALMDILKKNIMLVAMKLVGENTMK